MKILMVCLGNICRSPLAEGILQHKIKAANLNWVVDSAGTNGYHINEAPHDLSQRVAKKHGIDISNQICRRITGEDFIKFDRIYIMAQDVNDEIKKLVGKKYDSQKIKLLMNEVYPDQNIDIPDPWYGPEAGYNLVYNMIDEACEILIKQSLNN